MIALVKSATPLIPQYPKSPKPHVELDTAGMSFGPEVCYGVIPRCPKAPWYQAADVQDNQTFESFQ